jgi:hypothetical protein
MGFPLNSGAKLTKAKYTFNEEKITYVSRSTEMELYRIGNTNKSKRGRALESCLMWAVDRPMLKTEGASIIPVNPSGL